MAATTLPKIKSSIDAAYTILMIASVVDGNYTYPKGTRIVDYLVKYGHQPIDIDKANQTLLSVTAVKENIPVYFHKAIGIFHELNDEAEIIDLIGFVHSVITADNKPVEDEERKVFTQMCKAFKQPDLAKIIE